MYCDNWYLIVCSSVTPFVTMSNFFQTTLNSFSWFFEVKQTNKRQFGAAWHKWPSQVSSAHLVAAEGSSAPAGSGGCPSEGSGSPDAAAARRGWAGPCRCRTSGSLRGSLQFGSFYTGAQWKTSSRRTTKGGTTQTEHFREREECI